MNIAINLAKNSGSEVPVAGVIVKNNQIIAIAHNLVEQRRNATMHAEMICVENATRKLKSKYLSDCDIFVTLEPCAMCACALSLVKINAIYFGAYDEKIGAIFNTVKIFNKNSRLYKPKIYDCILGDRYQRIIENFFKDKR